VISFPPVSSPKPCTRLFHSRYIPRPSHSRFYHPHNSSWVVQILEFLIKQFSPPPCYLIPLRPNILNTLFSCQWPSFTPIQNNRQHYSSVYRNL
jgi:hypothetical protein